MDSSRRSAAHASFGRLTRREALIGATAALIGASIPAAAAPPKTIRAVMHAPLRLIDPITSTAYISRDHGYMVYDTLVAADENFQPQPQMAEWTISDDKLAYTFKLREGLVWHDGRDSDPRQHLPPANANSCRQVRGSNASSDAALERFFLARVGNERRASALR